MMPNDRTQPDRIAALAAPVLSLLPALLAVLLLAAPLLPAAARGEEKSGKASATCEPGENLAASLSPERQANVEREAASTANGEGRLFAVRRDGVEPSYLFGTMHLSDPRVVTLPPAAEDAFAGADRLVVETLEIADEAQMAATLLSRPELTTLPSGETLDDHVPQERRGELERALEAAGMPLASVRTLQPWFITTALVVPPCELERQRDGAAVLDLSLIGRAEAAGQATSGLETALEQVEALASLSPELQAENLLATLSLRERLPDIFETMVTLYLDGRIAAIMPTIETVAPAGSDAALSAGVYTAFEERVVTRRNHTMAERLRPLLDAGGAFVAVGALHLPGDEGLVELLRTQGWMVERAD